MAELATPPGLPAALEGVLNLAGVAIPVLRLDRCSGYLLSGWALLDADHFEVPRKKEESPYL